MTSSIQPVLSTARLLLRPFLPTDADDVQRLAGEREIAENTLTIPHPYPDGAAAEWIATHAPAWAEGRLATFAVTLAEEGTLVGAVGLDIHRADLRAELGYWIGKPWWSRGYATEAGHAVLEFGFGPLGLHRIMARHFLRNPSSGRVLQKLGMQREGVLRHHVLKWGTFEDLAVYSVLAE